MSLSVGIVGLPNVGKSTLFNALLKKQVAFVANYPFATIEPNVGVVAVPDERLEKLAKIYNAPIVPASVSFTDIAGLIGGAHKGEGLGNKFLAQIREVDAIVHVVRAFTDDDIIKEGSVDPKSDFETIKLELDLADLDHPTAIPLSKKPFLIALNCDDQDLKNSSDLEAKFARELGVDPELVIAISAKVEAELSEFEEEDRMTYLKELGVYQSGLERLIVRAFRLLDLKTFLTAGEKEARAWTIRNNDTALVASGVIHTDFMAKFIKAEVVDFEDFVKVGGWKKARELGKVRLEGRDYIMQDGDVIEFKIGS